MRTFLRLAQRRPEMEIDIVTLASGGRPLVAQPRVRVHEIASRLLNRLLYHFREARNPLANAFLLAATSLALTWRAVTLGRRYDVVYAIGGPIAGASAVVVSTVLRVPAVVHFHWAYHFSSSPAPVRRLVRAFYERFALIIGNSRLLAEDAAKLGVRDGRCTWVYNWVDDERFRPLPVRERVRERLGIAPDAFVFLYVGRFCHTKQTDLVASALRRKRFDAVFLFAGDGELAGDVRDAAAANDVRLLGTQSPEQLAELHNAADVQLWGSVDVDYPGLVVMEAMASGLPVVTSDTTMNHLYPGRPVDPDLLGGPALTRHYPSSVDGIVRAIDDALARREELRALRPRVRAFAQERFGNANAERLLALIASVRRS